MLSDGSLGMEQFTFSLLKSRKTLQEISARGDFRKAVQKLFF